MENSEPVTVRSQIVVSSGDVPHINGGPGAKHAKTIIEALPNGIYVPGDKVDLEILGSTHEIISDNWSGQNVTKAVPAPLDVDGKTLRSILDDNSNEQTFTSYERSDQDLNSTGDQECQPRHVITGTGLCLGGTNQKLKIQDSKPSPENATTSCYSALLCTHAKSRSEPWDQGSGWEKANTPHKRTSLDPTMKLFPETLVYKLPPSKIQVST